MKKSKKKIKKNKKRNLFDLKININHKRFCELYVKNQELFGNATLCYAIAFGFNLESLSQEAIYSDLDENGHREKLEDSPYTKAYNTCSVNGKRLLSYAKINDYINELLNELMTDDNADAELAWVMHQRAELGPKIQAIREFNKVKGRITEHIDMKGLNLSELYKATQDGK